MFRVSYDFTQLPSSSAASSACLTWNLNNNNSSSSVREDGGSGAKVLRVFFSSFWRRDAKRKIEGRTINYIGISLWIGIKWKWKSYYTIPSHDIWSGSVVEFLKSLLWLRRTSEWATRPMELEIKRNSQTHPLWLPGEIPSLLLLLFISRHSQQHNTHRKREKEKNEKRRRWTQEKNAAPRDLWSN